MKISRGTPYRSVCVTIIVLASTFAIGTLAAAQSSVADPAPALSPREIVERSGPAVVMIETEREGESGKGSGFVVEESGTIVTSLHVIDSAESVRISLPDGLSFEEVAVRSFDIEKDIAVMVVDLPSGVTGLPTVEIGEIERIGRGDRILVIGNPLGFEQTATEGIVSAWREPEEQEWKDPADGGTARPLLLHTRLLQISAALSPGSSGGPVFDEQGAVIGVAASGVLHGMADLNFAVPIDGLHQLLAEDEAMDLETFHERADDIRFDLAQPLLESAEIAYENEEREEAKYHVERALLLYPRYAEALLLSGRLAMEEGRFEAAEQSLNQALSGDEYNAEAWYLLGRLYDIRAWAEGPDPQLLAQAADAFEKVLELDGGHTLAAFRLAVIALDQGSVHRAEQLLLTVVDADPRMTDAHYMLGEIYLSRGEINDAKDAFETALWEDPDHALSHFGLAKLYTITDRSPQGATSQHGAAPHHWEEFLRLSENDPSLVEERRNAIRILRQILPHLVDE